MEFIHSKNQIVVFAEDGKLLAEVTFPENEEGVLVLDHTFVDDSLRGQGVAEKLMLEFIDHIKDTNKKVKLTCSYAIRWFEKHPEYGIGNE